MDVRKFGYIRVSSKDQNEGRQLQAMKEKGLDERDIFMDKQSGKNFDRVQYQLLKRIIDMTGVGKINFLLHKSQNMLH